MYKQLTFFWVKLKYFHKKRFKTLEIYGFFLKGGNYISHL